MNILPSELILNGIDTYLSKYVTSSRKIYLLVIAFIVLAISALPFVYVDISVQDAGIIRPISEKTEIKSSITERIDSIYVKEGQTLRQGDTILTFLQTSPDFQIEYQKKRIRDLREHISDLTFLSKGLKPDSFASESRRQEYALFIRHKQEQETNLAKSQQDLERNQILFEKGVISAEEYENYRYEYDKDRNASASLQNDRISQWQNDLNSYTNSLEEMTNSLKQQLKEKDSYVIVSLVNGTLDQFSGIYRGSMIQSGSLLAVVSPDSTLYAEIDVSPSNIGYISTNMPVNIQVGSFNYNEWGSISGKVTDISSDFLTDNTGNKFYYKVKCSMDRSYLIRKNGVKGLLKKGMTVNAHFRITRRSLLDCLYQKMDDWMNPTQNQKEE
ncbi:MAG: HlyD family secretion protein [Candidatus Azobacteroides sp.]|nr:HlyD family secretion protein [Candidatus Azobacteroides sp.]